MANSREVAEFYIGRTARPTRREYELGADDLRTIYKTTSANNSEEVEQALIDSFYHHPKCSNESPHSGGGVAEGRQHWVYVAIWRA